MAKGGTKIRGITIEIGGDTSELQKSLKAVDSSLKNTQTQLKDVNKLLKLDPTNTELLKQKQELLGKSVDETKKRLETLNKALEEMQNAPNADETIEQQNALKREIIETEHALEDYEEQLSKSNVALNVIAGTSKEVAEKTKALSAAAAGVAGAMLGNAVNAAAAADDLNALSQQTGFTVEQLQKMKYAADVVDVSVEDMTGSIQKMTKTASGTGKAFEKLGVAVKNENGEMRDATDIWYDTLDALGKIDNETERDALSMEIFGKSAMSLAGIIDDGGQSMKELGQEAEDLGLILSQEMVDDANEMQDAIDKLKGRTTQAFLKMGSALATSLVPMMEKLLKSVTKVLEWFSSLSGTTQTVILAILGLVAAISPLASLISNITEIVGGLSKAFTFFTSPVGITIAAIAALIAIGVALYKNWDTIKAKLSAFKAKWQQDWQQIKNFFVDIWENMKNKLYNTLNVITDWLKQKIEFWKNLFKFNFTVPGFSGTDTDYHYDQEYTKNYRMPMMTSAAGTTVNMVVNGGSVSASEMADIVIDKLTTTIRRNGQRW